MKPAALAVLLIVFAILNSETSAQTRNIMLTGYWPPTNDMIRQFNANPSQNPNGWVGANWEGRGYDIYAFFPEFEDFPNDQIGTGDFEVDYQDTSEDWWRITGDVEPVGIITFSRGSSDYSWELETQQRNLGRWAPDMRFPFQPTPSPPDNSVPARHIRETSLPIEQIRDDVNADPTIQVEAFIDDVDFGGGFLSEFIAYHGAWYHELHDDPLDSIRNVAAGHIHVGGQVTVDDGRIATEISLRALLDHIDSVLVPEPGAAIILSGMLCLFMMRKRGG